MLQCDNKTSRHNQLAFLSGYGIALVSTGLSALVRWLLPWALTPAPYLGFYPAVVVSAALGGVGPGLVSTFTSLLLVNFVFGRFNIHDSGAMARQVIWVAASLGVSLLAGMQRAAQLRERRYAEDLQASEAALRASEERFRTMFERHKAIMLLIEPESGAIVDANASATDFYGRSREELCSLKIQDINQMPADEVDAQRHKAAQGGQDHFVFPHLLATGETRWVEVYSTPVLTHDKPLLFSVIHDITERRVAEEALQEKEAHFRTMANAMPQLSWTARADGHIFWYNQRWYDYTGTIPEQMEGWGWQSVHDPGELPKVMERWQASIATVEPFDMTFPLRGADGVFRPFLTRVIPLKDAGDRVLQWFGTNTDISALKQAEAQIKASLAEKDVMLREIHHRVKNNLQVISSLVSLQADGSQDETVREVLRDVTYRVRSMALVHEKLYQSNDLARVDFGEYTRSLLNYLWRAHGAVAANVRLTLDLEPVSLPVDTAVPCGLILNELAGNALKHAFRDRSEGEVTVALQSGLDGRIRLSVADNGVGLPAGLDWRLAPSLGLRLVQMLSGQLGADVEVSGGGGTRFEMVFGIKAEG